LGLILSNGLLVFFGTKLFHAPLGIYHPRLTVVLRYPLVTLHLAAGQLPAEDAEEIDPHRNTLTLGVAAAGLHHKAKQQKDKSIFSLPE
jgi:hypothetical protein